VNSTRSFSGSAADWVIDVLRAIIGMESQEGKRKSIQQLPNDRKQVRLADLLAGGDELELRHAVHRVDVVHPFHPVLVALMKLTASSSIKVCSRASSMSITMPCIMTDSELQLLRRISRWKYDPPSD
jgi:hypothetical protein